MGLPLDDDFVVIQQGKKLDEPTVVTVNCPDKAGLGCDLCRIILEFGLYITRADISTDGIWCYIVYWVVSHPRSLKVDWESLKTRFLSVCPSSLSSYYFNQLSTTPARAPVYLLKVWIVDQKGLLHDVTENLCQLELTIQRVKVMPTPDGRALDLFFVSDGLDLLHTKKRQDGVCDYLKEALGESCISCELQLAGPEYEGLQGFSSLPPAVAEELFSSGMSENKASSQPISPDMKTLIKPTVMVDNSLSPVHTLLQIQCADQKGLCYDIMRISKDSDIKIAYGRFSSSTKGFQNIDLFVQEKDGKKIIDPKSQIALCSCLKEEMLHPLRVTIVNRGPDTELLVANPVELSGKGRPRVFYDVTLALKALGIFIFSAEVVRHSTQERQWEVYRFLLDESREFPLARNEARSQIVNKVRRTLMGIFCNLLAIVLDNIQYNNGVAIQDRSPNAASLGATATKLQGHTMFPKLIVLFFFSEEWKSCFPISVSSAPPLLLSGTSAQPILGPLFFNPKPESLTHLFSSPSLLPPLHPPSELSLTRFLVTSSPDSSVLLSTASSVASLFGSQYQNDGFLYNRLEFLKYPDKNCVVVFFPTGVNSEKVGFLVLYVKGSDLRVHCNSKGDVFEASSGASHRIARISVNPVDDFGLGSSNLRGNSYSKIGYLLASTLYSVHWFTVKINKRSLSLERPSVIYLGGKYFKTCSIAHACWSPHLHEESVVLLESGQLFLFDLESHLNDHSSNVDLKGTRLRVPWDDSVFSENKVWLSCEFSWHPRILIVARSDAVFLVDLRADESKVSCLMKVEMLSMYAPARNEQFLAFSKAGPDHFYFTVASTNILLLCDVRKPMMPVLQWAHGLDSPCYINVLSLSKLRSHSREDTYKLASESGFCIILGSFWNCEFNLFCYGSSLPFQRSVASKFSRTNRTLYAWELPSEILLSGHECPCGSCLVREGCLKGALPEWTNWQMKKEIVLGFGILNNALLELLCEPDDFGGFSLIRLMTSGKLELQRYKASFVHAKKLENCHEQFSCLDKHLLYSLGDEEYKFTKRFSYLKLNYLNAYSSGNLSQMLVRKLENLCVADQKESFGAEVHEILCEKLNACGFGRLRSSPAMTAVFNDVSLPTSLHEVAFRRLWSNLPLELLQLAFSNYSESSELAIDQEGEALEFLGVPDLPQLPPFFLRNSSLHCLTGSDKVQPSGNISGPVLPLPFLLVLHEFHNGCSDLGEFSVEAELNLKYSEVKMAARDTAVSASSSDLLDDNAVSLADDLEETSVCSPKPKPFVLYRPVAFKCSVAELVQENSVYRDRIYDTVIFHVQENNFVSSQKIESAGLEIFDDLCPVELRFDAPVKKIGPHSLKSYNILKRQLSKWQKGFYPYKEFCIQSGLERGRLQNQAEEISIEPLEFPKCSVVETAVLFDTELLNGLFSRKQKTFLMLLSEGACYYEIGC
ncbi:hypothetical protein L6164_026175 [Bauhinia variegata]|uniref:Uncharacterized protein n=1 Tax=Bauhinia variegata TaxID=167791 RepID=A0ACB9LPK8_BAUVA|nr:hypothetical protein L6164_026175 [Bauhinia variegata]